MTSLLKLGMHKIRLLFVGPGRKGLLSGLVAITCSGALASELTPAKSEGRGCSSAEAREAKEIWERDGQRVLAAWMTDRLKRSGDVYALYDVQIAMANMARLAEHCGDVKLLDEMLRVLEIAVALDESGEDALAIWRCRDQNSCGRGGRLGKEIELATFSFVGLYSRIAVSVALGRFGNVRRDSAESAKLRKVAESMASSTVLRWMKEYGYRLFVVRKLARRPTDAIDGLSRFLLSDQDLMTATIALNAAALSEAWKLARPGQMERASNLATSSAILGLGPLWMLLAERLVLVDTGGENFLNLDAGFWRYFPDMRFSGYDLEDPPVNCTALAGEASPSIDGSAPPSRSARMEPRVAINVGWDISHARRLADFVDALRDGARHARKISEDVGRIPEVDLLRGAIGNDLVKRSWNQSSVFPLFSNYWGGANGWYRAGYDTLRQDSPCIVGYAPSKLGASVLTGGLFAVSGSARLLDIAVRLEGMAHGTSNEDRKFMSKYYPTLVPGNSGEWAKLDRMNFLASAAVVRGIVP